MRTLVVNALRLAGPRTAMGRYIEYMAMYWSRMEIPFDRVIFTTPVKISPDQLDLPANRKILVRGNGGHCSFFRWEQYVLPRFARGAAGLFCPSYTCPLFFYGGPIILANHGIYEMLWDEFHWWRRLRTTPAFRMSARRANYVIANSQTTKTDLRKWFHVPDSKMEAIYPAANELFFERHTKESIEQEVVKALGENAPYILFVGKLSKRRNVPCLIEAFSIIRSKENLPHRLLIIGPNTNDTPIAEIAAVHGVSELVKHHSHMEQERLAKLYAGAELFVLPTIYEGISWTMLEAMASGTAVLTVEHPTLPEGGGDAVFSVPSSSVGDVARGMTALLTNPGLREEYEQAGRFRAAQFSWRESAQATMAILDRVALPTDQ